MEERIHDGIKEEINDRFRYLNNMCIITIGKNSKEGPYYPNSIQEYLILKQRADTSRNRSGLGKKKKTAESGITFLQYVITQDRFMEEVSRKNPGLYKDIYEYSNPIILKTPLKEDREDK
jgi:hypothetical protein